MNAIEKVILTIFLCFCFAMLFVYFPFKLYAKAECLRNGYPYSYVTIGLERYCGTIEGSVNAKVIKQ